MEQKEAEEEEEEEEGGGEERDKEGGESGGARKTNNNHGKWVQECFEEGSLLFLFFSHLGTDDWVEHKETPLAFLSSLHGRMPSRYTTGVWLLRSDTRTQAESLFCSQTLTSLHVDSASECACIQNAFF